VTLKPFLFSLIPIAPCGLFDNVPCFAKGHLTGGESIENPIRVSTNSLETVFPIHIDDTISFSGYLALIINLEEIRD
jgi:hypothetical protein